MAYLASSPLGQRMMRMEPVWMRTSPVLNRLVQVYGTEMDTLEGWITEMLEQLFVRGADDVAMASWGLDYWEEMMALPYGGNLTDQQRADRIVAKMRSYRQATPFVVRLVANSFENGSVEVIEDFSGRRVIIRFNDVTGVPPNITDLQAAMYRLIRASALIEFQYTYLTWGELLAAGSTWQELKTAAITWAQLKTMRPASLP